MTVTANGTATRPTWYGLTVDGNMIANILSAIGVDADWITTGTIRSRDGSVQINLDSNTINIKGVTTFSDFETKTNLKTAGSTTINGSNITTGSIKDANSNTVFNLSTGALTMKKGSIDIGNGTFKVDTSGNLTMKSGSIDIGNGTFKVDTSGNLTMKSGSINIGSGTFKVDTSGNLTATSANIRGTIKSGSDSGYWVHLNSSGEITGGYGSSQYGYIDFSASSVYTPTGQTYKGIQIQGGILRISTYMIAVARSTSTSTTATTGGNGTLEYISKIQDNGDGTITWWESSIKFINGIMVSQL